jgi:SAM-dependent methyltransferase
MGEDPPRAPVPGQMPPEERAARIAVGKLAREFVERGDPTGWFEPLYEGSAGDPAPIPWADLEPNPLLVGWLERERVHGLGAGAIVVGCGLGDDAEELARRGFAVTAFDLAPTAVAWARRRFPASAVSYEVADLLAAPGGWRRAFPFVLESYTVQALPAPLRERALRAVADLVAPGGRLLLLSFARDDGQLVEGPPWPLSHADLEPLVALGAVCESFEDVIDGEGKRRLRVAYRLPGPAA